MTLSLGFSPCPNDCFMFDAIVNRRIDLEGLEFEPRLADVEALNQAAFAGEADVTKLSYHAYAYCTANYVLLDAGSALGRHCGPLLISKRAITQDEVAQGELRIAIPGKYTTANFLLGLAFPRAQDKTPLVFSEIEAALQNIGIEVVRDKIAIIQIGAMPDRLAAVVTGRVDSTALEPGFGQVAKEKGLFMLTDLTKSDTPYVNTVINAQRRYLKENPQQLDTFLKGIVDALAAMANPANERAIKNVLIKRLKLPTVESAQVLYDATVQMHSRTKVPNAPVAGVQNMIDTLLRVNPRLAKVKAADIIDNSFVDRLEKSGYIAEVSKRKG
jgi:hypothetical protein